MRKFANNLENRNTHNGLYRVWVPAIEGRPTPLVARWIVSEAKKDDQHQKQNSSYKKEPRTRCSDTNLRAA